MKTLSILSTVLIGLVISGCSSNGSGKVFSPKKQKVVQEDFILRGTSHTESPLWAEDIAEFRANADPKFTYAVGEVENAVDKSVCQKLAQTNARLALAEEIATSIQGSLALTKEGQAFVDKYNSSAAAIENQFASMLKTEANQILVGVTIEGGAWDEKDFSASGGARSRFECKALAKMSTQSFEEYKKRVAVKFLEKEPTATKSQLLQQLQQDKTSAGVN